MDQDKLWKILKEMGIPDHLTCLLRNLYADQEATLRTGHGTTDWIQIGKGVHQGCILSPCLFNLYAGTPLQYSCLENPMGRGARGQIADIRLIIEKTREFQKKSTFALLTTPNPLTVWITTN